MLQHALTFLNNSSIITWIVLGWLSIYFIMSFTILLSRYVGLSAWQVRENSALERILMGGKIENTSSILKKCTDGISKEKLEVYIGLAETKASSGLTLLAIVASTSPFIGLFGTVVSILETFARLDASAGGINAIALSISEALVATGCGIFVAIPAYSFNLMIKRKAFEIVSIIKREANVLLSYNNDKL